MVAAESLTGEIFGRPRVQVDAQVLRAGLKASHPVTATQRKTLTKAHASRRNMDPEEEDLFSYLYCLHHQLRPRIVVSSGDKGVVVVPRIWVSATTCYHLLSGCGISQSKLAALDNPHRACFFADKRTKVMLGIIP